MTLTVMVLVGVAGACGALCRAMLAHAFATWFPSSMPWGTWAVNLLGSFAFGALLVTASHLDWPAGLTTSLAAGFLGAFTTFSTWMYETMRLIEQRAWRTALANIIGPLVIGPPLVMAGSLFAAWAVNMVA